MNVATSATAWADGMPKRRKYSVSEIDRMRAALSDCNSVWKARDLEDRLRTYMLNGTDPEELEARGAELVAQHNRDVEENQAESQADWEASQRLHANARRKAGNA
jgi:hypothetical protein